MLLVTEPEAEIQSDVMVTVCAECRRASCWHAIFFCDDAQTADIVDVPRSVLLAEKREHPSYLSDEHLKKVYGQMLHAIDYHGTFSRDPGYYRAIVPIGKARGHSYVLVTGIEDGDQFAAEVRREVGDLMPIVFAAGHWKREAALAAGFKVDVWEDDNPEYIAEQDPRKCVGMRAKER